MRLSSFCSKREGWAAWKCGALGARGRVQAADRKYAPKVKSSIAARFMPVLQNGLSRRKRKLAEKPYGVIAARKRTGLIHYDDRESVHRKSLVPRDTTCGPITAGKHFVGPDHCPS